MYHSVFYSSRILVVWQFTFTFTGILYSLLQGCKIFGNVTVKNYLNESCCRFSASLFTVKVPSRQGFDVIYQTREGVFHRISKHREAS